MGSVASLLNRGESELIIEKSRFLGFAVRVDSREEAEAWFSGIRELHKAATHHVPAFVIGPGCEQRWASDDNEPQGTAGMPILKLIEGEDLTNIAVMVVRYFGGVKLGTGGLAKAYTDAAKEAILSAGKASLTEGVRSVWSASYASYDRIERALTKEGFKAETPVYGAEVGFSVVCAAEDYEGLSLLITNSSAGEAVLKSKSDEMIVSSLV